MIQPQEHKLTSGTECPDSVLPRRDLHQVVSIWLHDVHPLAADRNLFRDTHAEVSTTITAHRPQVAERVEGDVHQGMIYIHVYLNYDYYSLL